jgi:hypothetical protein
LFLLVNNRELVKTDPNIFAREFSGEILGLVGNVASIADFFYAYFNTLITDD